MELNKAEKLIEALKTQLSELHGARNVKDIYEHFKKLRSVVQKCKTKIECIKEIKDDSIKSYINESEEESGKKEKIDQLTRVLQKSCKRMEDEIEKEANGNLNNSVGEGSISNANGNTKSKKGATNKTLDEEANKVLLEKIKLFEDNFLFIALSDEAQKPTKPSASECSMSDNNDNASILSEIARIIEKNKIFSLCTAASQRGVENFTEKTISDLKAKIAKTSTDNVYIRKSTNLKEKFQLFMYEHFNGNGPNAKNLNTFFSRHLQKCEAEAKKQLEAISYPSSAKRIAIYLTPFIAKQEENSVNPNKNEICSLISICFVDPIERKIYFYLQNSNDKIEKENAAKVFLPFSTLRQMKNGFDFYEEYLRDFVFESHDFNFYFDVAKFKEANKHVKLLEEYKNDYKLKYPEVDLDLFEHQEVFDNDEIKGMFYEFSSHLLWSNNFTLLKSFCGNLGIDIVERQIN